MQTILASDPVMKALAGKVQAHHAKELARIGELEKRITNAWAELRELKCRRGLLNRNIANRAAAIRSMTRRTRIRKSHVLNRRIATRKALLRQREEKRMARAFTRQAILAFRKRVGIPPAGVQSQDPRCE